MPRAARLRITDVPLHVVQRGHDRANCFFDPPTYGLYLGLLAEYRSASACDIHAYVLMPNHIHLLLSSHEPDGCTRLMRRVNQRYAQFINRQFRRTGSPWQGRFWSSPVQSERYFMLCQRYIELNPVRASIVPRPEAYSWSSFRANALGAPSTVITPHPEFLRLGSNEEERMAAYRELFGQAVESRRLDAIREALRGCRPLGSDDFVAAIERLTGRALRKRRPGPSSDRLNDVGSPARTARFED